MALAGVELEALVFETDALTTRPPLARAYVRALLVSVVTARPNLDVAKNYKV